MALTYDVRQWLHSLARFNVVDEAFPATALARAQKGHGIGFPPAKRLIRRARRASRVVNGGVVRVHLCQIALTVNAILFSPSGMSTRDPVSRTSRLGLTVSLHDTPYCIERREISPCDNTNTRKCHEDSTWVAVDTRFDTCRRRKRFMVSRQPCMAADRKHVLGAYSRKTRGRLNRFVIECILACGTYPRIGDLQFVASHVWFSVNAPSADTSSINARPGTVIALQSSKP